MASQALTILADHRERPSGVVAALVEMGVQVRTTALPIADYIVARGVGIERKTVADLHRSILDRRLWSQIASLRVDLDAAYLVVEGVDIDRGPISHNGIRGALLEVVALGVPVLWSRDTRGTASWLTRIASRGAAGDCPRRAPRRRPRAQVTATSVLSTVPGISPRLAAMLLAHFGSIAAIATASTADLATVPGIGPRRASVLTELLRSHHD